MSRRKIQKKLNKKKIIAKRKQPQRVQKKPTADQSTRMNEMLKVALARQQPTISTTDPNALATNKKIEELDSKRQKQIDALTDRLVQKEREAAVVQGERQHQERVGDLKRQINAADQAIEQNKQAIKDNKAHQDIEDLKRENEKKQREQEAYKKIIDSEEFKNPSSKYVKQLAENERYKTYTSQLEQMQALHIKNAEDRARVMGLNEMYDDIYNNKKNRYTMEYVKIGGDGKPEYQPLCNVTWAQTKSGRPYFIVINGRPSKPKEPLTHDKQTNTYKDADGKDVYTYTYVNNYLTDYEIFQRDLLRKEAQNRNLQRELRNIESRIGNIEGIRDQLTDLNIENTKLKSDIMIKTRFVDQYYDKDGKPTQKLNDLYNLAADTSHQQAINEARLDLSNERLEANKAELQEHKQKEYTKAMRDAFESDTFQAQRDEIAEAQNRANFNRVAREETQKDIELQKALIDQQNQKQLLELSQQHGGISPEALAQVQTQIANQLQAAAKNPDVVNLYGKFKYQFDQLDNPEQTVVERILNKADLDINTFLHPERYGFNVDVDQYKAANKIAEDVITWVQNQDPNDLSTKDSEVFIQNYVF